MMMNNNKLSARWATAAGLLFISAASWAGLVVTVDGDQVDFASGQPMMMGGRVMVPLRGVFEHMGADVKWKSSDQSILCERGDKRIFLRVGSRQAEIDGRMVSFDSAPIVRRGTAYVPLRFIGEALGAEVDWNESTETVAITTDGTVRNARNTNDRDRNRDQNRDRNRDNAGDRWNDRNDRVTNRNDTQVTFMADEVIRVRLDNPLSTKTARVGDQFRATIDTGGAADYYGLRQGTQFIGRVDTVRQVKGDVPAVLGLTWERVRTPDGRTTPIQASLIGLDNKSIEQREGRWVAIAKPKKNESLKYVGLGAAGGALVALVTKGNVLTDAVLGAALGYLYDQLQNKNDRRATEVNLEEGTVMGVKLEERLVLNTRS